MLVLTTETKILEGEWVWEQKMWVSGLDTWMKGACGTSRGTWIYGFGEVWAGGMVISLGMVNETMIVEFTWDRWGAGA